MKLMELNQLVTGPAKPERHIGAVVHRVSTDPKVVQEVLRILGPDELRPYAEELATYCLEGIKDVVEMCKTNGRSCRNWT